MSLAEATRQYQAALETRRLVSDVGHLLAFGDELVASSRDVVLAREELTRLWLEDAVKR